MNRWNRYWFAEGGRYSVAVLRIALALTVWFSLAKLRGSWPPNAPGGSGVGLYHPIGLWMLLGDDPPSVATIDLLWSVARVSTLAMLLGAFTRTATVVSFLSSVALASLYYSGNGSWSHQYNVVFIAQLAYFGARGGDTLSLDAAARRLRGLPALDVAGGYQWSVRLVQLAVALMFASGMFHKVVHYYPSLDWVLSDNLRHHLLVRFDLIGNDRTAVADWLLQDVWRYRTAAALNLIAQTCPLVACFLMKRPVLRALGGVMFAVETIALVLVMDLWNLHWLPLAAVFVDWDALIAWGRALVGRAADSAARAPRAVPRVRAAFVIGFVVYEAATSFIPRIDQLLNTYPFSGFPMFAVIRARRPYDQHQPYSVPGVHFELVATAPVAPEVVTWLDNVFHRTVAVRHREKLRVVLQQALNEVRAGHPEVTGLRAYYTLLEVPAYPERPRIDRRTIALLGELHADGRFRSLLGSSRQRGQEVVLTPGDEIPAAAVFAYRDDTPASVEVAHGAAPWQFSRPSGERLAYVAALERQGEAALGERWLVATWPR